MTTDISNSEKLRKMIFETDGKGFTVKEMQGAYYDKYGQMIGDSHTRNVIYDLIERKKCWKIGERKSKTGAAIEYIYSVQNPYKKEDKSPNIHTILEYLQRIEDDVKYIKLSIKPKKLDRKW